uniref:Uncharacterized protein n=1 Tax=Arundo donax TaxID=35708 RepID=A0A0A9GS94_ARUDO
MVKNYLQMNKKSSRILLPTVSPATSAVVAIVGAAVAPALEAHSMPWMSKSSLLSTRSWSRSLLPSPSTMSSSSHCRPPFDRSANNDVNQQGLTHRRRRLLHLTEAATTIADDPHCRGREPHRVLWIQAPQ